MPILRACVQCGAISDQARCETHRGKAWEGSTRRTRTASGWKQQRRAKAVMNLHNGICHVCDRPCADQVDHVIPLSQGGPDTMDNLRPIHSTPCHAEKTQAEARAGRGAPQGGSTRDGTGVLPRAPVMPSQT